VPIRCYGAAAIVSGVSISVGPGEAVSVIGPNGAGKSTLLKAVTGRLPVMAGKVTFGDRDITNMHGHRLARMGLGFVPQTKDVFDTLTVTENLEMGGYLLTKPQLTTRIEAVLSTFPALAEMRSRTASKLSGGERKMLAIARVLMLEPTLLVLDEPTSNLSPELSRAVLQDQVRRLADSGTAVLLVEQKAFEALGVSDWAYILVAGRSRSPARPARSSPVLTYARYFSANPSRTRRPDLLRTISTPSHVHHEDRKAMSETGERVDDPSRPRDETSDHPSGMIRQPALRAKGKYVSKSDMVTDALRELITDRQLSPGTPLRQRDLAEQFDVSYTPVREALRRLESEGLVVTDVHRGATVARTESEEMEENYRILAALEALAGSRAVSKMTNDDVTEIEALYQQVAACQPDDDRLAELNRQFHFRIYECARSPMLLLLLRLLWRSFPRGPQAGPPHQVSVRQHAQLVRALKRRNEEEVAAIIRDHVLGSIKYLPQREALP
jgi:ABC-type branched-subunit amino acid transport system ATPase component/DNA-binding GntR family transcriptional regulator